MLSLSLIDLTAPLNVTIIFYILATLNRSTPSLNIPTPRTKYRTPTAAAAPTVGGSRSIITSIPAEESNADRIQDERDLRTGDGLGRGG